MITIILRGLITMGSGDTTFGGYEDILRVSCRPDTRGGIRQRQGLVLLDKEDHLLGIRLTSWLHSIEET